MDESKSTLIALEKLLTNAHQANVLVIGDMMLDKYQWGKVERISPEAPVPIVDVIREESRLGGAANVARNLYALGANPAMCGVVGDDSAGEELISLAEEEGFGTEMLFRTAYRRTTVKERIIAHHQQMLRVDKEDRYPLVEEEKTLIFSALQDHLSSFDAIVFEDYDKSMIDAELIQKVIQLSNLHDIPVMVDPKFNQFWDYGGSTVFKPNLKELNGGLGARLQNDQFEQIVEAGIELRKRMHHEFTLITLSSQGLLYIDPNLQWRHIPAHYRNIADVSGAGDTVISVVTLGWIAGLSFDQISRMANLAGGLVCEEVGVVPISKSKLEKEVPKLSFHSSI